MQPPSRVGRRETTIPAWPTRAVLTEFRLVDAGRVGE